MFNQGSPPIEGGIKTTETVIHRIWFCHAWNNIGKHYALRITHPPRTYPFVGEIKSKGINWNPCLLLCTRKLLTSNMFCNKTVLNRFSSCSLKPRCIIGLLPVTFLLIAIIPSIHHLWWHLHRPEFMPAQPTTVLMRLRISVAIAVYSSLKDWENPIRPDVIEPLVLVSGASLGIDCTTNYGRNVFTLLEVKLALPSIICSFTAHIWLMVDVTR